MDIADRVQLVIYYILCLVFGVAILKAMFDQQWFTVFLASLGLFFMIMPALIQRNFKIFLPIELELFFGIFLFGALYLGEAQNLYFVLWWWDKFLHTSSGMLLGLVGFLLVYILNNEPKIHLHLSPFFVALFSFAFAVTLGVLWEIFEFIIDQNFLTLMQRPPMIYDTMWDLMVDAIGAFLIAVCGYFYVKKVKLPLFDRFITRFLEKNPKLFKRWRRKIEKLEMNLETKIMK